MEQVRVELQASGGFAGLSLPSRTLDTSELEPPERDEIVSLVDAALGELSAAAPPRRLPDSTSYTLTIRRGGRVRQLVFDDTSVPQGVRPLLDRLNRADPQG